jgi:hypothetical protein
MNIYLSLIVLALTFSVVLVIRIHITHQVKILATKQLVFFRLILCLLFFMPLAYFTLHTLSLTNHYSPNLLIQLAVTEQTLVSISLVLHAMFAYVFAFSTIHSVIVSSFLYMYIKLALYYLISWLKAKFFEITKQLTADITCFF